MKVLAPREGILRRREFITLIAGSAATWPLAARAQEKLAQIGVLWHAANEAEEEIYLTALRRGLADRGLVEGRNIALVNTF
ncbi:MAG: hypothetical protein ACJ8FU_11330, partial [Xanthobacteraceae bacterium]